ncbi:hypothetical protein MNBD_CHLOROFLEXI01-4205, partial [hydrothermal vent metagenome]
QERAAPPIRELKRREWQAAFALDQQVLHDDLNWPEKLKSDAYKTGFWVKAVDFLNGRHKEIWVMSEAKNQLTGLATLASEWGRSHRATIRVHPSWRDQLERPLLAKLIRRLHYLPRRSVQIEHPDDDELMNALLQEANFQPRRTLTHMRLDLKE